MSKVVGMSYLLFSSCETLERQMQRVERTLKEEKQPNAKVDKGRDETLLRSRQGGGQRPHEKMLKHHHQGHAARNHEKPLHTH